MAFKQHLLKAAIKTAVTSGKFVAVKSSYKLSEAEKKGPPKKKVRMVGRGRAWVRVGARGCAWVRMGRRQGTLAPARWSYSPLSTC